jgi:hypothetical protein
MVWYFARIGCEYFHISSTQAAISSLVGLFKENELGILGVKLMFVILRLFILSGD